MKRTALIEELVQRILAVERSHPVRVGIDGVDAAGKTTLADELVAPLGAAGRPVVRAGIDSFHHPSQVRYRRGRDSPEGYLLDSFDHDALVTRLLAPLGPGGDRRFRTASFDYRRDAPVDEPARIASDDAVLLFDGNFLHRRELRGHWDLSLFLRVPFSVTVPRAERRDDTPPEETRRRYATRYVPGQRLYLESEHPERHASLVIDNTDPAHPTIVRAR